jgi:hypothetical protein
MSDHAFYKTPLSSILKKTSKNNEEKNSYSKMPLGAQENIRNAIDLVTNLLMRPCWEKIRKNL